VTNLEFAPYFPWIWLAVLGAIGTVLIAWGLITRARGVAWRTLAVVALLASLGPALRATRLDGIAALKD